MIKKCENCVWCKQRMNATDPDIVSCFVDPGGSGYSVFKNRHACCKHKLKTKLHVEKEEREAE